MRIAIVSSGRLWLCDLARELCALGHSVQFHSFVPPWRTRQFGLPAECNRWLGPYVAPVYATSRALSKTRLAPAAQHLLAVVLDRAAAHSVEACDVLIGASHLCLATMERVRRRFGAQLILERGSRHILSQRQILENIRRPRSAAPPVPDWIVHRELAEYALAHRIVVPSKHAERSFIDHGIPASKLFRNPYGVDLNMFPPTPAPPADAPSTIIMVGAWSARKGCDLLIDAWQKMRTRDTRLLHVGNVDDLALPSRAGFTHHDGVDQRRLTQWYGRAHVMALASREEGLALVQAQGLASGLPLVATDFTGAEDLRECLADPSAVTISRVNDADSFAAGLDEQLGKGRALVGMRDLLGTARSRLTWAAYGQRYDAMLRQG